MIVGVGSSNPVKVKAVEMAVGGKIAGVSVQSSEVESGVAGQPMSDEETRRGAYERAMGILKTTKSDVGIGLEGGVFIDGGQVWNTVWCCVVNRSGRIEWANGSRFILPEKLSQQILKGKEMGPAMEAMTGIPDLRKKMGMLGIVTNGWVNRESEYRHLVELAFGRLLSDWK